MFSPTRSSSHYLLIRTSTLGILSEVSALVIQSLSVITFTNWASGLKNTSYLNHCSWQGGMVLPIGKKICFLNHSVHTGLLALVIKRPRAGMCHIFILPSPGTINYSRLSCCRRVDTWPRLPRHFCR